MDDKLITEMKTRHDQLLKEEIVLQNKLKDNQSAQKAYRVFLEQAGVLEKVKKGRPKKAK
jgi:predicted ATPase